MFDGQEWFISAGSGTRSSEAINPPAPAPAPNNTQIRLTQLECQMAEIRDIATRDVQQELRRFRYKIGEIHERFNELVCTSETLYGLRVGVDRLEAELIELQRQGELDLAPSPQLNQRTGNHRFPIPIQCGERSTLYRLLKRFYT